MKYLPFLVLTACGPSAADQPCADLCETAATAMETCLAQDNQTWENTVYENAADFLLSCETWTWEMKRLASHQPTSSDAHEQLAAYCDDGEQTHATASCADVWAFDWNQEPWFEERQ